MNYKFLNSKDVDRVIVEGTMVISSLGYFRSLENTAGGIGDPLEGGAELTIRDAMVATEGSPELAMINNAVSGLGFIGQFAKIEGGGRIELGNGTRFVHLAPELYIYSFSVGHLESLIRELCDKELYDACIRVKDPTELGRACFNEGVVRNLQGHHVGRVDELFGDIAIGLVEYAPRSIDITEGRAMTPDPFKKGECFRAQSEERIVFVPLINKVISEQRLVVVIPNSERHFLIEFRDRGML